MKKAILIIDHGSRLKESNDLLSCVMSFVKILTEDVIVNLAHMELSEPSIEEGFSKCVSDGATHVIAVPYMLSPGRHATKDVPNLVAEAASQHQGITFEVSKPLGVHQKVAEVIIERAFGSS